jgi:uncharacterized membrane protein YgdD (TMEM256/DUF423 family)
MIVFKIATTVLIVLTLLFVGSLALMNFDEKREEFWAVTAGITCVILVLGSLGLMLLAIWTN